MQNFKFTPGTIIPAGYVIAIETWENDGDDYKTHFHFGCSEADTTFFALVKPLFESRHSKGNHYGNSSWSESIAVELVEILIDNPGLEPQFKKFLDLSADVYDKETEEFDSGFDIDDLRDNVIDHISNYAVGYGSDFIRVVETIEVYYNPTEYVVPKLPLTFVEAF
ncbi:hypothetical protein [Aeromonas phage SW69-9]|uniref:Uncharacterized protein n=2 Tax=Biquartavirus 44RR2 TaxID=115987 RepID=Q6U9H5_9CAUD|nr:hypothetical protein ST44RRORF127c [Aeromonas phage 44RR2.8t]APU00598.1 hypothetical protein [Aeromonas phage 44RR2.8t.2]APU01929.1 hypothetical protein [Aeromonas phage L9-6]APU02181.1 hypothetical protein [Aeromonas phage Riv-10]APU02427.1 hypothetical protein [Aeromonas phage SW69-9]AAQ81446.1 hypothetical protein 44RRORF127c [Aeromonas phage 44RR2.8t]